MRGVGGSPKLRVESFLISLAILAYHRESVVSEGFTRRRSGQTGGCDSLYFNIDQKDKKWKNSGRE